MKKRILVIEKNVDLQELLAEILLDEGYEVTMYGNEDHLFEKIVGHNPDAILLDIIIPTVEGTELCRQIKAAETTQHIPVIVLSTHPKIDKVKGVCADEVVQKPFDIDTLLEALKEQF